MWRIINNKFLLQFQIKVFFILEIKTFETIFVSRDRILQSSLYLKFIVFLIMVVVTRDIMSSQHRFSRWCHHCELLDVFVSNDEWLSCYFLILRFITKPVSLRITFDLIAKNTQQCLYRSSCKLEQFLYSYLVPEFLFFLSTNT